MRSNSYLCPSTCQTHREKKIKSSKGNKRSQRTKFLKLSNEIFVTQIIVVVDVVTNGFISKLQYHVRQTKQK